MILKITTALVKLVPQQALDPNPHENIMVSLSYRMGERA
jgi:hypothetical protein